MKIIFLCSAILLFYSIAAVLVVVVHHRYTTFSDDASQVYNDTEGGQIYHDTVVQSGIAAVKYLRTIRLLAW